MKLLVRFLELFVGYVCIYLGGGNIGMAKKHLDRA